MTPEKMELLKKLQDAIEKAVPRKTYRPNKRDMEILCQKTRKLLEKAHQEGHIPHVPEVTGRLVQETGEVEIFIEAIEE